MIELFKIIVFLYVTNASLIIMQHGRDWPNYGYSVGPWGFLYVLWYYIASEAKFFISIYWMLPVKMNSSHPDIICKG